MPGTEKPPERREAQGVAPPGAAQRWNHNIHYGRELLDPLRARAPGLLHGDFLAVPFEVGSFDLVTAVASLHHMDEAAALSRMAELLRPGGTLAVVGLARTRSAGDLAFDLAGAVLTRARRRRADAGPPAPC